jgi:RNA polymerase sigma-70 factor (ECF subfamily)
MGETLPELLARCRAGDEPAIGALVRRFQPWATALASGILDDPDAAEDAAQEAFLVALDRLDDLREPEAFAGWFRQIVRAQAHRVLRKRREVSSLDDQSDLPAPTESVRDRLDAESLRRTVREALAALSTTRRQTAELFYLEEKSCSEIADTLRIPLGTVKRRLHDARNELRNLLLGSMESTPPPPTSPSPSSRSSSIRSMRSIRSISVPKRKTLP